jgi:hypothetical protein
MNIAILREIVLLTGLPEKEVEQDLLQMILEKGYSLDSLSVENLRDVLATYMQDALLTLKADYEGQPD